MGIFLLNILLVQKIRLIFASIKRTFKKHLIISNISFYIPISYPHKCIIEVSQRCLLINGNLPHKTQVKQKPTSIIYGERVQAREFLFKTQAFLCFSPFVCPLLHRELITPNGHEQLCLWPSNDCFMAVSRVVHGR